MHSVGDGGENIAEDKGYAYNKRLSEERSEHDDMLHE